MFAIGNDELENAVPLKKIYNCKRCGKLHLIKYGQEVLKDGTKVPSDSLAFITCEGKEYLVGMFGKQIGE